METGFVSVVDVVVDIGGLCYYIHPHLIPSSCSSGQCEKKYTHREAKCKKREREEKRKKKEIDKLETQATFSFAAQADRLVR